MPAGCVTDGSLMLNMSEMVRPENSYETFSETTAKFIKKIATFYQVSASDTLAVCAMVAPTALNPKVGLANTAVRLANAASRLPMTSFDCL
jgi:hypothetical protein